ncbi:MAG: FG-GAP repeat protein [Marinicella sp.]
MMTEKNKSKYITQTGFSFYCLLAGVVLSFENEAMSLLGPEQRVVAMDNDNSDWFGRSVDIDGDFAIIGAPGDDEAGTNAGAAYVFMRQGTTWVELQKLTAGIDADNFDEFGFAVAIERDLLAVGARWDDDMGTDAGAVYLYEWDGMEWLFIEKLLPNDPNNAAYSYGTAVDIGMAIPFGGTVEVTNVVVGAPLADNFQGVVFLVQRNGDIWQTLGRFSDSDNIGLNDKGLFGSSVEIHGDVLIAGAPDDDQLGSNAGAAYIFGRANINNIWSETSALYPTTANAGDRFGFSVAIDEGIAVVGAPANSARSGRIFTYANTNHEYTAGGIGEEYGSSVAIDMDSKIMLVGAKRVADGGPSGDNAGATFILTQDEFSIWQAAGEVKASDAAINKEYGEAVAISRGIALIGGAEEDAFTSGAAYIYTELLFKNGFE